MMMMCRPQSTVRVLVFCLVVLFCVLINFGAVVAGSEGNCHGLGRVPHSDVVNQFKFLAEQKFIGQDQAIDITISALRKFKPNDLLLLHFVGASGTGKTYLGSLAQRSFFKLKQCKPFEGKDVANRIFCPLFDFIGMRQEDRFDVMLMHDLCGAGYADFLSAEDNDQTAKRLLENALEQAFSTRMNDNWPVIIFLDNFNMCKQSCEKLMTKIVSTRRYRLSNDKEVSLANCVLLVTSDLSQEGLRLLPGEERRVALERVLDVVSKTWGEDSLWNDRAHVVPFTPYSDMELSRILELTITEIEAEIRSDVHEALQQEKARLNIHGGSVKWSGRFVFTDNEKRKLIDRLHREIAMRNCRAFEKIKGKLIAASRRPEPIESRILAYRPIATDSAIPDLAASVFRLFKAQAVFKNLEYTQNIVFKSVEDSRMVIIEIDDIDGYEPVQKMEL